jgi:hypothetical protein
MVKDAKEFSNRPWWCNAPRHGRGHRRGRYSAAVPTGITLLSGWEKFTRRGVGDVRREAGCSEAGLQVLRGKGDCPGEASRSDGRRPLAKRRGMGRGEGVNPLPAAGGLQRKGISSCWELKNLTALLVH